MTIKICKTCGTPKDLSNFPREMRKGRWYYLPHCKSCVAIKKNPGKKIYRENNKDKLRKNKAEYYQINKEIIKPKRDEYRKINKDRRNELTRQKRKSDPIFQLRDNVRTIIKLMITKNYGSKNGSSINNYLQYSIQQLKDHLQSKFEFWMTWNNHGKYDVKTWNDDDSTTWTWQLDHIIPQSDLPYASMNDDNFRKCWALENLRPLSAKINSIEGARRIRHKVGQ